VQQNHHAAAILVAMHARTWFGSANEEKGRSGTALGAVVVTLLAIGQAWPRGALDDRRTSRHAQKPGVEAF